ncbi:hypothetical protein [Ignicoccus hospitalis]|uniref:hypothetical protein n=1 Tax=Ignicoccus hospitalis TaxID=160233 RepID=UPI0011D03AC3|nr:hypothetical protein [Ignicoccus hospitalis]HIH90437.1 hypothetical protein [Desulfurococcaceae archaeon]
MIAKVLVAYSLATFTVALTLAPVFPKLHIDFMRAAVVTFPHGVALAYVASLSKGERRELLPLNAPLLALPFWYDGLKHYLAAPALHVALWALSSSSKWKGAFRRSLQAVAISYFALTIYSITSADPVTDAVRLLAYPFALIYAVSCQSFPKTFGEEANWPLAFASSALSLALLAYPHPSYALGFFSPLVYLVAAKFYNLPKYYKKVKGLEGVARRAQEYFWWGHALVIPSSFLPLLAKEPLTSLHASLLGFVALHIFIHFPMMVPIILKVPNRRRYCKLPLPLALLSATVWPHQRHLAYALFLLAYSTLLLSTFELPGGGLAGGGGAEGGGAKGPRGAQKEERR